ncbi:hypothetical protein SAMN04489835_0151 [Mycolicibacterium rutilum]|uniref:Uncharacterized protein n=1 Tax=Mycolicibacterium rutilum TaxID=370526 RepID=A0A1H6IDR0_MYCRU|nr:hypothetical protein [Mycolicibacterium rutilum]SEH46851.1 hypothetical protein SAMN04489835_0151 [Mycolicibacterium rutilum]
MNANTTTRIARFFALPFVTAGLLASAFFFSAAAHAGTYSPDNSPRPGIVATPDTHAHHHNAGPGVLHHRHGYFHVQGMQP